MENTDLLRAFGDLRGKRVMDIGCGQGDTSVWFALQGAEVWAMDVSAGMVEVTRQLAARHGVADRIHAEVCRVEDNTYADGFFDLIFADGVLHHLDLAVAVPNLARLLKHGGRGFFMEPQKGSLFIQIYRIFAKDLRTADERPLEPQDFDLLRNHFPGMNHREYHLASLVLFAMRFVMLKLSGKAFPYWMDEVRQGRYHPNLLRWLQGIDAWSLAHFPRLGKLCWMTVIEARKTPTAT